MPGRTAGQAQESGLSWVYHFGYRLQSEEVYVPRGNPLNQAGKAGNLNTVEPPGGKGPTSLFLMVRGELKREESTFCQRLVKAAYLES